MNGRAGGNYHTIGDEGAAAFVYLRQQIGVEGLTVWGLDFTAEDQSRRYFFL